MTGKLLPFARQAPRTPGPATPIREREPADDLSDELARASVRETAELAEDASQTDDTDAVGLLYADDDGPD